MSASVRGESSASRRIVAPMPGLRLEYLNMSSAAIAGPTISLSVNAGAVAELGEQVAAQQRPGRLLVKNARLPAMRDVRRVEVADPLAVAEVDRFAVLQDARRAVGHVVQRDQTSGLAVRHLGLRRDRQPLVHRAALVGLIVAEGDPAQPLGRNRGG